MRKISANDSVYPLVPERAYWRHRASEMKMYSFAFPSRGARNQCLTPCALWRSAGLRATGLTPCGLAMHRFTEVKIPPVFHVEQSNNVPKKRYFVVFT